MQHSRHQQPYHLIIQRWGAIEAKKTILVLHLYYVKPQSKLCKSQDLHEQLKQKSKKMSKKLHGN